jgi:hypothetical protein
MKRIVILTFGIVLFSAMSLVAGPTYTIWTYHGVITDASKGAKFMLRSGQNAYILNGSHKYLSELVGQEVRISGTLYSKKTLNVVSISLSK